MLGSKTFRYLLAALIAATLLLLIGKLSGDLWVSLVQWLGGFATARGSVEHIDAFKRKKHDEIENDLHRSSDDELARRVVERTDK